MSTYSTHAPICAKFYELNLNSEEVCNFVGARAGVKSGESALFVGGMFEVAKGLLQHGIDLTVVDNTDEMVEIGKKRLPAANVEKADLRSLPYRDKFDAIYVVGGVFTHMISNDDLMDALQACRNALHMGGRILFDNYEDSKIRVTNYFNGAIECRHTDTRIVRTSATTLVSESPYVVRWDAEYSGEFEGKGFSFSDSMEHRAFSREEVAGLLPRFGLELVEQGDNFDETSFFTLARAF